MVSLIAAYSSASFTFSHQPSSYLNLRRFFPVVFVVTPLKTQHPLRSKLKPVKQKKQNQLLLEFSDCCGVVGMCRKWEVEGDFALELEVLDFMNNSKNPEKFPSKRELVEAGKGDLVEAILKRGGWMSLGWEDEKTEREENEDGLARNWEFGFETNGENPYDWERRSGSELSERENLASTSSLGNSSQTASSSGRSIEMTADDESGIEGILNRLMRQRSLSFGLNMRKNAGLNNNFRNLNKDRRSGGMAKDVDSCHPERSRAASFGHDEPIPRSMNGLIRSYSDVSGSSLHMDSRRRWSLQRAGFSDEEFADAEIDFGGSSNKRTLDKCIGDIVAVTTDFRETIDQRKELNSCIEQIPQGDVKTRLRHLEVELSSALCSLKSNLADLSEKANQHLFEDLRQHSDASEFQENEIMNAQGKLRSLRAKNAVLEGKMTLAIIEAQKILGEKQKRINDAHRALQLLRTTCIVWANSGSEVLLAGSFDGWATQRKMERSRTGIFSLQVKLYPGKYEIKFIVDGSWKVDPLRPIVNSNGFENNLLIIS